MTKSTLETEFEELWAKEGPTGFTLVPQYPFQPRMWTDKDGWLVRRWRFDYAIPECSVAIELEGLGGWHQLVKQFREDCEKYTIAASKGWLVLRFTGNDVSSRGWWVVETIEEALHGMDSRETDGTGSVLIPGDAGV